MLRARASVYARAGCDLHLEVLVTGYGGGWRSGPCRSRAWLLLLVPAVAGAAWGCPIRRRRGGVIRRHFSAAADLLLEARLRRRDGLGVRLRVTFNNIQVMFFAFVGGVTFGVITTWALFFNGCSSG